jgi:transmembrane sensor
MDATPSLDAAAKEAIDWEVRLRSGEISLAEREAFAAWRESDPAHEEAWKRLQDRLGKLRPLQAASGEAVRRALDEPSRTRRRLAKAGAGLAVAVVAGAGVRQLISTLSLDADYRNRDTVPQRIALDDSISATAGVDARVYLGDRARGEVFLAKGQIAIDGGGMRNQNVVVSTRDGMISAERAHLSVDVLRLHTVVAVQGGEAVLTGRQGIRVHASDGSAWSLSSRGITRMPETSADIFSWTRGRLVVLDRAVPDVLETLGRYFSGYIHFPESALTRRVSGVFPLDDVEGSLRQLAEGLGFSFNVYQNVFAVASRA